MACRQRIRVVKMLDQVRRNERTMSFKLLQSKNGTL